MRCPDPDTLAASHHGRLGAAALAEVRRHLGACAACRREIEEMERLDLEGEGSLPDARQSPDGIPRALWEEIRQIRSGPVLMLRIRVGGGEESVEMIDPCRGPADRAVAEPVPAGAGVRGPSSPAGGTWSRDRSVFRVARGNLAGTVIIREETIRILVSRAGRPVAGIPVALTGASPPTLRCTGGDGSVRFEPLPPGRYLLRLYDRE